MGVDLKGSATNNADWNASIEVKDDSGTLVDFTGAAVAIEVKDSNRCRKLYGTIADGKITLPQTGVIEWLFPVSDMRGLCPGAYSIGGVYELNGATVSLFTGTLTVTDGVATL